jgi:hypothetical protein
MVLVIFGALDRKVRLPPNAQAIATTRRPTHTNGNLVATKVNGSKQR